MEREEDSRGTPHLKLYEFLPSHNCDFAISKIWQTPKSDAA